MIDAVDLQINGAVYLAGEVPDGLHRQLAACVQLNFGADEDDAVYALHPPKLILVRRRESSQRILLTGYMASEKKRILLMIVL